MLTVEANLPARVVECPLSTGTANPDLRAISRIVAKPIRETGRSVSTASIGARTSRIINVSLAANSEAHNSDRLRVDRRVREPRNEQSRHRDEQQNASGMTPAGHIERWLPPQTTFLIKNCGGWVSKMRANVRRRRCESQQHDVAGRETSCGELRREGPSLLALCFS